ncbi:WD40 repeat-like protein [Coniophora puteana RWD-64-598 SS2]|uniref:WD40 repeat-like protein n=1 Tax=Coniophora puteana (strain RWD-64-598) TaxID=741705 RepID=A0A5M3N1L3_CONPW|nr:WD40 repeat-like protein [Coniophora puteana RWD-64-598 SS2]EIW85279.1 WD40 repeat-like protein [Coniophora puteana RWD-64-598 SS2]
MQTQNYACDTLPAAKLAGAPDADQPEQQADTNLNRSVSPPLPFMDPTGTEHLDKPTEDAIKQAQGQAFLPPTMPAASQRKLCVRHLRMADEGTNLKLQQALDALPIEDRQTVSTIWSSFSSSAHPRRELILQGILTMCCFSQLSLLTEQLGHLIRLDPFVVLPREVALKVLAHLDATSLCRAAQVSRLWRSLADDDILWRGICEQHIGQRCRKCGWGLPILEHRRTARTSSYCSTPPGSSVTSPRSKRAAEDFTDHPHPTKRLRSELQDFSLASTSHTTDHDTHSRASPSRELLLTPPLDAPRVPVTRPWKDVYSERLTVERNWRRGRCTVRTLKGHADGVMCLQFSESMHHPSFPVLITGSYDRTIRVWNLETGKEVRCLRGHTRAVRALQFDEAKLITGSMDHTIRVWNWRRGECIRTLEGHTEGVVCLNFDNNLLASGSVDTTIKIWNFRTGEAFTLRGHRDWVNSVRLWDVSNSGLEDSLSLTGGGFTCPPEIGSGRMLFSASDDGTIKLWNLCSRSCVRQFTGHVGQVQSLRLLAVDEGCDTDEGGSDNVRVEGVVNTEFLNTPGSSSELFSVVTHDTPPMNRTLSENMEEARSLDRSTRRAMGEESSKRKKPVLISGSLDNTINIWDIETGKVTSTLFGHIEGVWAVACDKLRIVSASHDRTIKLWNREEGRCTATLFGHRGAVTCLGLGEDKIVSGSDDGDVRVWSFSG